MQKAILCFEDWKKRQMISGISQGQNEGSHINLNGGNDWNGIGANEQCDLLAPYDCKVMAVSRLDNTVFFQSLTTVQCPMGEVMSWFMCTHMNDVDFNKLGIKVGKIFKQFEVCYTEGTKGIGSGDHIHMEQGFGTFGGGSSPYYKSKETYRLNGKTYYQYYPVLSKGSYEAPVYDIFYLKSAVTEYLSNAEKKMGHKFYKNNWMYDNVTSNPVDDSKKVEELRKQVEALTTKCMNYEKQVSQQETQLKILNNKIARAVEALK